MRNAAKIGITVACLWLAQPISAAQDHRAEILSVLIDDLVEWIAREFDLPVPLERAQVEFTPADAMGSIRADLGNASDKAIPTDEDIIAFYDPNERTIYLPDDWSETDPTDISVLVHELTHDMEFRAGDCFRFPMRGEKLAFRAQAM